MIARLTQDAVLLLVAACGSSSSTTAQTTSQFRAAFQHYAGGDLRQSLGLGVPAGDEDRDRHGEAGPNVAAGRFDGSQAAGRRCSTCGLGEQGGLLDVVVSPSFAADQLVYLTYAEPSSNGGSGLAVARAKLVRGARAGLEGLQVIWRDPAGGNGGQFGAIVAFAPDGGRCS